MLKYSLKRLLDLIPTIFLVTIFIFIITRIIPGNPAAAMLGPQASPDEIVAMEKAMGLDQPYYVQFLNYLNDLLHFDLGESFRYGRPVFELIMEKFPNTIILSLSALSIALLIGIPMGIISAINKGNVIDLLFTTISLLGVSIPIFWLGIMMGLIFGVNLKWFPSVGIGNIDDGLLNYLRYLVLPSITLATIPMANFARILRSSMFDVIEQNYIKTAKAKGVSGFFVIMKHAFKNAFTPLLTVIGMQMSGLLSGAVLTETIFSWPGMGRLIVDAIDKRDFIVVQGTVLFIAILYVLINLVVDLMYKLVNPKVSIDSGGS